MKVSTILAVFGLASFGATQSSSVRPASVSTVPSVIPIRPSTSSSRSRRSTTTTTTSSSTRRSRTSTSTPVPTVITTVVNQFVTICAQPTTFYVNNICYTATSSNQAVTVTNCPCTVQAPPTAPATGVITGSLAVPTVPAVLPPPAVASGGATGVASVGAISAPAAASGPGAATATQYAAATSTKYVTAGSSKPTIMLGLMSFLMSLPLLALLLL